MFCPSTQMFTSPIPCFQEYYNWHLVHWGFLTMRFTTRYNSHFPPFSTALAKALFNMIVITERRQLPFYIVRSPALQLACLLPCHSACRFFGDFGWNFKKLTLHLFYSLALPFYCYKSTCGSVIILSIHLGLGLPRSLPRLVGLASSHLC